MHAQASGRLAELVGIGVGHFIGVPRLIKDDPPRR
jgi:hypothetical protein